jgi:hypothetical protein
LAETVTCDSCGEQIDSVDITSLVFKGPKYKGGKESRYLVCCICEEEIKEVIKDGLH